MRSCDKSKRPVVIQPVAVLCIAGALFGCSDGPTPPVSDDRTPPTVSLTFPQTIDDYDNDDDGLIDISVSWADSNGIALQSVKLQRPTAGATNLMGVWAIERIDSAGLVIEEVLEHALPGGTQQLTLTVPNSAGNARSVTIDVRLPFGSFFKSLGSGTNGGRGVRATVCAEKVYVTDGNYLHIANANTLQFESDAFDNWAASSLYSALCIQSDSILYVTPHIDLFNRNRETWAAGVPGTLLTEIAASRNDPDLLYIGYEGRGRVGTYSRATRTINSSLPIPLSSIAGDYVDALAVLPGDSKIYVARYLEGNLLAFDRLTGIVRSFAPRGPGLNATVREMVVGADDTSLYMAVESPAFLGVVKWNVTTDTPERELRLPRGVPLSIAIGANGRRLFVTTFADNANATSNYLIDIPSWSIVAEFPRVTVPGEIRTDGIAAFRSDGRVIFVPRNGFIDTYINRD